jgi:hypothetical protein
MEIELGAVKLAKDHYEIVQKKIVQNRIKKYIP